MPKKTSRRNASSNKTTASPNRPAIKGNTRETILAAAEKSLLNSHLHGLRYSQIAKEAGVPQPLMGYHFPTLEALMMELVHRQLEKLRQRSVASLEKHRNHPRKALEAYIRSPFEVAEKDAVFRAVWTSFYHLTTLNSDFANLNSFIRNTGRERILTLLALAGESKRPSRSHPSPKLMLMDQVMCVQAMMTGFTVNAATETGGDYARLAELAVTSIFAVLELDRP